MLAFAVGLLPIVAGCTFAQQFAEHDVSPANHPEVVFEDPTNVIESVSLKVDRKPPQRVAASNPTGDTNTLDIAWGSWTCQPGGSFRLAPGPSGWYLAVLSWYGPPRPGPSDQSNACAGGLVPYLAELHLTQPIDAPHVRVLVQQ
jgi:hypothetical protein